MLPSYVLSVDILAGNATIDEKEFRELISPCLAYLDALKGAFDRKPCVKKYFSPEQHEDASKGWSVRCVLMISVGKNRADYLTQLYEAIVRLIVHELPDLHVQAEMNQLNFS